MTDGQYDDTKDRALELLRKARLKLSSQKVRFFGLCIFPIQIDFFDKPNDCEAYVFYNKFTEGICNFANIININIDYIRKHKTYNVKNFLDILLHEHQHMLRRHDARRGSRDNVLWNIACDHIIDSWLKSFGFTQPIVQWNIIKEIENDQRYQSEEAVYEWLLQNQGQQVKIRIKFDGSGGNQGGGVVEVTEGSGNHFDVSIDLTQNGNEPKNIQQNENYLAQIRAMYNIEVSRGTISSEHQKLFDELLEIKVPWESVLEKALKTNAFEKACRRNWRFPNKYYSSLNMYLPGRIKMEENTGVGTLLVHIDSSGSMSDRILQKCGKVILESADHFAKIHLIVADVSIHQKKDFFKMDRDSILEYFKSEGIKGRGGTSHEKVFDYFEKYVDENVDDVSICISLTDLESDIEYVIDKYNFWKKVPILFLNTYSNREIVRPNVTTIHVE